MSPTYSVNSVIICCVLRVVYEYVMMEQCELKNVAM
jgi:hypothetical protein